MTPKLITILKTGLLPAVAILFAACNEKESAAEVEKPSTSSAPSVVKIFPPSEALKKAVAQADDKEGPHDAKEKLCYICNPALRDPKRLWCKEHDRYEERCFICHPEIQEKGRLFCKEHFIYEDECYLCHPELVPAANEKPQTNTGSGKSPAILMCKEHEVLEQECGICHPDLLGINNLKIRFGSKQAANQAGVSTAPVVKGQLTDLIEVYAELAFNQNRLTEIAVPVQAIVKSVLVDLGSKVKEGDVLARVSSVEISSAAGKYLRALTQEELAIKSFAREKKLNQQQLSSQQELEKSDAALETARVERIQSVQQLLTLGFDTEQIAKLSQHPDAPVLLDLRAPFSGEIAERNAVQGKWLDVGTSLFTLVDTTSLWAFLSIPESDLPRVKVGQEVKLMIESGDGEIIDGTLTWISPGVDEDTRMIRARAEFRNPNGILKARMFARAHIINRHTKGLLIPQSAIQDVEGQAVAFVRLADELFDVRPIRIGLSEKGKVEILSGLQSGDQVVVASSFIVKSQFLISRLGAGCVDD